MKILLFDIDGTLVYTGGAGLRGMTRAFEDLFGIPNALEGLTLAGMTDTVIFKNACRKAGIEFSENLHKQFKLRYLDYLQEEINRPLPGKKVLPGVPELFRVLQRRPNIYTGLLTGNYQTGARIKLGHFDLNRFFSFGAFGDDHCDRNQLLPYALKRFHKAFNRDINGAVIYVIGDTPRDVECARPHGAKAIAVATGDYTEAQLQEANPDYVLKNLNDIEKFLSAISEDP